MRMISSFVTTWQDAVALDLLCYLLARTNPIVQLKLVNIWFVLRSKQDFLHDYVCTPLLNY